MGYLRGCLYCSLWYSSILAGYAGLFCPLFPLLFISNKLYRYLTDVLFIFWQYYPTALLETLCKCEVQISGDPILAGETSILVMNHRTRTDWNFMWPSVYHCVIGAQRYKHPTKFVLKDIIRHIPGPGWVMQLASFIYIKRCWVFDRVTLNKVIGYFHELSYKYTLLVFPEGTDLTESTRKNSNNYAGRHNLQGYDNVLHPRTTGFSYMCGQLLERDALDAVYDVTLVYPDVIPQTEKMLLRGEFPKQVKVHLARYPSSVLPRTEDGLKTFLEERWHDKEKIITEFFATGQFLHGQILRRHKPFELYTALIFWTLLPYVVLYLFATVVWFRQMVIAHSILLLIINATTDGFQTFEAGVFSCKRKLFGRGF